MSAGSVQLGGVPRSATVRAAVWTYAGLVGAAAVVLWSMQLTRIAVPCAVPDCDWPRLSADGFADVAARSRCSGPASCTRASW